MVKARPPPAAASAEVQSKAKSVSMIRLTTRKAVSAPAPTPKAAVVAAENGVFDQEHRGQAGSRRPEDLQDRRVGEPRAAVGGERAGEHQHRGQKRDAGCGADRQRELRHQRLDRFERVANPDAGDLREVMRHRAQKRDFLVRTVARGQCGGDELAIRRALERIRRIDEDEIDREAAPVDLPEIGDLRCDVAPEHVDDNHVADFEAKAVGDLLLHRDERGTGIVARPPCAGDDLRALGRLRRESHATVAFQRPGDILPRLDRLDRRIADLDEPAAHHRHFAEGGAGRLLLEEIEERRRVRAANVEEEETRRHARLGVTQLGAHIEVDQGERNESRESESQRQHDRGRQRAGPVDRRKRHAELDGARSWSAPDGESNAERDESQDEEGGQRRGGDSDRDGTLGACRDREPDERDASQGGADDVTDARPAPALLGEVANKSGDRQVVRPAQRNDRKGERNEKAISHAERDDAQIDRRRERNRQEIGKEPVDDEGDGRAERGSGGSADESDDKELEEPEHDDARSSRADRLQDRQRSALSLDEALRRVGDADPADDQRQQSRERQELGEPVEVAGEVG